MNLTSAKTPVVDHNQSIFNHDEIADLAGESGQSRGAVIIAQEYFKQAQNSELGLYCDLGTTVLQQMMDMFMSGDDDATDREEVGNATLLSLQKHTAPKHINITEEEAKANKCAKGLFEFTDHSLPSIVLLVIAAVFVLALIWVQRRKTLCVGSTGGRPGVLRPFSLVYPSANRFIYLSFWAVVAYDGIQIVTNPTDLFIRATCADRWVKPIMVLINVHIFAVLYFPVIGGLSTNTTLGQIIATCWIWALGLIRALNIAVAITVVMDGNNLDNVHTIYETSKLIVIIFMEIVPALGFLSLIIYLPIKLLTGLYKVYVGKNGSKYELIDRPLPFMETADGMYVRELIKKQAPPVEKKGIKKLLDKFMYRNVPNFRYSALIMATVAMAAIFVYYILFADIYALVAVGTWLFPLAIKVVTTNMRVFFILPPVRALLEKVANATGKNDPNGTAVEAYADRIVHIGESYMWCFYYANVAAVIAVGILQIILLLSMFPQYRDDRLRAMRNKYHVIMHPSGFSGRGVIGGAVRYMGFQVVMYAWGAIIQLLLFTLIGVIIGAVLIIPLIYGFGGFIIAYIWALLPALGVTIALAVIQQLLVAFAFTAIPCGPVIAVNNERWYSTYAYLAFFKNLFVGLVGAILRIVFSVVIGAIVFPRLDMPCVTPKFKQLDAGFKCYEALIHLEHAHMNPIVVTFVNLVLDRANQQAKERASLRARLLRNAEERRRERHSSASQVHRETKIITVPMAENDDHMPPEVEAEYERIIEADRKRRCRRFKWQLLKTVTLNPLLAIERQMKLGLGQFNKKEDTDALDRNQNALGEAARL